MAKKEDQDEETQRLLSRIDGEDSHSNTPLAQPSNTLSSPTSIHPPLARLSQNDSTSLTDAQKTVPKVLTIPSESNKETYQCRICLEEDSIENLERPCGCSGTQSYAHHECIQRWINEKHEKKCEICDQEYVGNYTVPARPQPLNLEHPFLMSPMFIRVNERTGEHTIDILDDRDPHRIRPRINWCSTLTAFIIILMVLRYSAANDPAAQNSAYNNDDDPYGGSGAGTQAEQLTFSAFLFVMLTKVFMIGMLLYMIMKMSSQQAQRQEMEMLAAAGNSGRVVFRMRAGSNSNSGSNNNNNANTDASNSLSRSSQQPSSTSNTASSTAAGLVVDTLSRTAVSTAPGTASNTAASTVVGTAGTGAAGATSPTITTTGSGTAAYASTV